MNTNKFLLYLLSLLFPAFCFAQKADSTQVSKDTTLTLKDLTLNEVVVFSKIGVTQVEPQKIKYAFSDLPSQNGGTAGDILKNMPSVAMGGSPNHNRDIRYRGLGNGYTTVLINGKQAGMIGNNRETVLDMIPATQIEYIEIISNPSADNVSNGINGIVNIVLKKGASIGTSGQVSFFADNLKGYNSNASVQHTQGNFSISGSFEKLKRNADKFDNGNQIKYNTDGSVKETVGIDKSEIKSFDNTSASLRASYQTKNNWKVVGEYFYGTQVEDKTKEELNRTFNANTTFKSGKSRMETELKNLKFHNPSVSLEKNWENSSLVFALNTNFTEESKAKTLKDYNANAQGVRIENVLPAQQKENEIIDFKNYFPSVTYTNKVNRNFSFKTGYQGFITERKADRQMTKINNANNTWEVVPNNTNQFNLEEQTHAGYFSGNLTFEKLRMTIGYRHEYTAIHSQSIANTTAENKADYHLVLPNASLTYSVTPKSYLKSSVGRRVRRPAYTDLNPFVEIKSLTEIKIGNPDLVPETAWAYELGYFKEIKGVNFGVNLFYRNINNLIQKSITTDADGITKETVINLSRAVSSGAELLVGFQATKWYSANLNFSKFWSEIRSNEAFDGEALKDQTAWTIKALQDLSLPKKIKFQIASNFIGPKRTSQESEETIWFTDVALEKQFLEKGFFTIRITDIFDSLKKEKTKNTGVQLERITENTPGRILSAGIRWQF